MSPADASASTTTAHECHTTEMVAKLTLTAARNRADYRAVFAKGVLRASTNARGFAVRVVGMDVRELD